MSDIYETSCLICGEPFKVGDIVTRVERVYRVGNIGIPEITERGTFAHYACAGRRD